MAETQNTQENTPQKEEPKIMCYISKRMVPKSQTVELEYAPGKKVWVLAKYVHFDLNKS